MSSEPERVFSVAGDVIGAALCLKSWDEMGNNNYALEQFRAGVGQHN
jgi:hypothetical protein